MCAVNASLSGARGRDIFTFVQHLSCIQSKNISSRKNYVTKKHEYFESAKTVRDKAHDGIQYNLEYII